MLQIVSMTSSNLTINCLLHPNKFVNEFVAILCKQLQSESVLIVDDPNKQEPVLLKNVERQLF